MDCEQIIPIKDAEDYLIKLANKKQERLITSEINQNRDLKRQEFWSEFLLRINEQSNLFRNASPSSGSFKTLASGYAGIWYGVVIKRSNVCVELCINNGKGFSAEDNKRLFDNLFQRKDEIEVKFGTQLEWERNNNEKVCKVVYYLRNVSIYNEGDRDSMIEFLVKNMIKLEYALRDELKSAIPTQS